MTKITNFGFIRGVFEEPKAGDWQGLSWEYVGRCRSGGDICWSLLGSIFLPLKKTKIIRDENEIATTKKKNSG